LIFEPDPNGPLIAASTIHSQEFSELSSNFGQFVTGVTTASD
jgi:hypothetical protein